MCGGGGGARRPPAGGGRGAGAGAGGGARRARTAFEWVIFGVGMVGYVVVMLAGVPRLTRWFFRGLGQDRDVRLTYLLSGMGLAAVVAGALGIEPIVGAFLAGLAFNRFVPDGTLIADRVHVLGRSLFIPAFLISTGMMLDPVALVTDRRTLVLGMGLSAAMVVTKWLASSVSGRLMRAARPERGLMFSLSVGQAAGALAAAVVGEEVGLLGAAEVNAVILVIMVSALIAGLFAERNAPKVEPPSREGRSIGKRVVVPVSNPATVTSLVRVAGQLAAQDAGAVVAVNVLPFDAEQELVRSHRALAGDAERAALAVGAEVTTSVRIDASVDGGVLHSVVEQDGTLLVMGWDGGTNRRGAVFGTVIDRCIAISPVPVLVCRPGTDDRMSRLLIVIRDETFAPGGERELTLALEIATRLERHGDVPCVVVTNLDEAVLLERLDGRFSPDHVMTDDRVVQRIATEAKAGDVVLAVAPPTANRLGRGARRLADAAHDRTVVVAIPR
jgi:nucleotide-binding universal stress UspA family protein